jgi:HTH-type transcriptional regulator / antitoxin HigA
MNIRPVKTEKDYDAALTRIEELWGAESGTPDGDELDVLLTLVGVYEDENHRVPLPTPIEAIKFVMDQRGFKQADLIPYLGNRSKISEVLNGKRTLTLSMIRALHGHLGIPAEVLIQGGTVFPTDGEDVNWGSFPIKEIVDRGVVSGYDHKTQAEEIMRDLASQAGADDYFSLNKAVCLRQGTRRNDKDNPYSINAWVLSVFAEANKIELKTKFNRDDLDHTFISKVAHLSVLSNGAVAAKEFLQSKGIKLVVVPHFKKTYLDGAVLLEKNGTPIIALTIRHDRLDNLWFTLAHELAHLSLGHVHNSEGHCIIDDLDLKVALDDIEEEADRVAQEALIPNDLWLSHPARETRKLRHVIDLARKADVHSSLVAGRIRFEDGNYRILSRHVGQGEVREQFKFSTWPNFSKYASL